MQRTTSKWRDTTSCRRCGREATKYLITYDHNELTEKPCGYRRTDILIVAACEYHSDLVANDVWGKHSQCMGWVTSPEAIEALFNG